MSLQDLETLCVGRNVRDAACCIVSPYENETHPLHCGDGSRQGRTQRGGGSNGSCPPEKIKLAIFILL